MAKRKLILDLDVGIDDALALAYICASPEVDLLAVTCTYGNVTVETSARNALAVLHLFGRGDVPVYKGITHSRATSVDYVVPPISEFIHGKNGIGEAEIPDSPRGPEAMAAVDFIIEAADAYGKDLVYVPTGALTNLAAVIEKDPGFKDKVGSVVMMGGSLTCEGNVNACVEANISQDPEAADLVFRSGLELTMVGLDVTNRTLLTKKETAVWRGLGTAAGTFLADMSDYYIDFEASHTGLSGCGLHDPLAAAVAIDPSLVKTYGVNLRVDLEGELRGRTIGERSRINDPHKTVQAALEVDVPAFIDRFMERLTELAR